MYKSRKKIDVNLIIWKENRLVFSVLRQVSELLHKKTIWKEFKPTPKEINTLDTRLKIRNVLWNFDNIKKENQIQNRFTERRKNPNWPDLVDEFIKNQIKYNIFTDFAWRKYIEIEKMWDINWESIWVLLIRLMKINGTKYVKLSDSILHSRHWEYLSAALTENHPLIWILRTRKWDKMTSITLSTLKRINDEISPKIWDIIKDEFYRLQEENLNKYFWVTHWWTRKTRLISKDHKDTVRAMPQSINENNIIRALFWDKKTKDEIADVLISRINNEVLEEIAWLKWWSIEQLKIEIKKRFNFWINYSLVWEWDVAKLTSHRDAITWAKQWWFENDIILYNISPEHTLEQVNKHFELENEIIESNRWNRFTLDWVEYDIVIENRLNPILIQAVRKGKKIQKPEWLQNKISESSNILNNAIDYIPPFIDREHDIKNANRVSKNLDNWIIQLEDLENNYKWYLWKAQYYEKIKWSDWLKISIDLIWLWWENRDNFRKIARIYKALMDKYISTWNETYKTRANEILWWAWMTVTKRIISIAKKMQEKYPHIDIRIWWDEFWFHNPKIKKWDEDENKKFLEDVNRLLEIHWFKWRTTYSFDKRDPVWIYDRLDNQWKISKWIEYVLEQFLEGYSEKNNEILSRFWITWIKEIKSPNNIIITVSEEIVRYNRMYWPLLDIKQFTKILIEQNWWKLIAGILQTLQWPDNHKKIELTIQWKHASMTVIKNEAWISVHLS